jgi:hypothetical protein
VLFRARTSPHLRRLAIPDPGTYRTIPVDHQDVAVAEEAKAEIIRQMKSMEGEDATVDSPISVAVDMDILRGSGNPQDRQLADVFAALTE